MITKPPKAVPLPDATTSPDGAPEPEQPASETVSKTASEPASQTASNKSASVEQGDSKKSAPESKAGEQSHESKGSKDAEASTAKPPQLIDEETDGSGIFEKGWFGKEASAAGLGGTSESAVGAAFDQALRDAAPTAEQRLGEQIRTVLGEKTIYTKPGSTWSSITHEALDAFLEDTGRTLTEAQYELAAEILARHNDTTTLHAIRPQLSLPPAAGLADQIYTAYLDAGPSLTMDTKLEHLQRRLGRVDDLKDFATGLTGGGGSPDVAGFPTAGKLYEPRLSEDLRAATLAAYRDEFDGLSDSEADSMLSMMMVRVAEDNQLDVTALRHAGLLYFRPAAQMKKHANGMMKDPVLQQVLQQSEKRVIVSAMRPGVGAQHRLRALREAPEGSGGRPSLTNDDYTVLYAALVTAPVIQTYGSLETKSVFGFDLGLFPAASELLPAPPDIIEGGAETAEQYAQLRRDNPGATRDELDDAFVANETVVSYDHARVYGLDAPDMSPIGRLVHIILNSTAEPTYTYDTLAAATVASDSWFHGEGASSVVRANAIKAADAISFAEEQLAAVQKRTTSRGRKFVAMEIELKKIIKQAEQIIYQASVNDHREAMLAGTGAPGELQVGGPLNQGGGSAKT